MKTIKAIIFGALIVTVTVSGFMLFCTLGAVDAPDLWGFVKMFLIYSVIFGVSALSVKYLYERWYRR